MAKKKIPVRENTGNLKIWPNTGKTQGILFAQVVNSLKQKVKDTAIFDSKISIFDAVGLHAYSPERM